MDNIFGAVLGFVIGEWPLAAELKREALRLERPRREPRSAMRPAPAAPMHHGFQGPMRGLK